MKPIRTVALVLQFTLAVACPSDTFAGPITYFVEPLILSDGYSIEGGFITTNGTLGPLSSSDILDYEVQVVGPSGDVVISPGTPDSIIESPGFVEASSTSIQLLFSDPPLFGFSPQLIFFATGADPTTIVSVSYSQFGGFGSSFPPTTRVHFSILTVEVDCSQVGCFHPILFQAGHEFSPAGPLTVATVPEPSSITLVLLGMCVVGLVVASQTRLRHFVR